PATIEAYGRKDYPGDNDVPGLLQIEYGFPSRGEAPPVSVHWHQGGPAPATAARRGWRSGVLFTGAEGELFVDEHQCVVLPEEKFADRRPPRTLPDSDGPHEEWLQAIRAGGDGSCNFQYAGAVAETVLLGNVAYRANAKVTWNGVRRTPVGPSTADGLLHYEYRRGWTL
ncbi:MAG: gfo/Idh/MocA family oxidoreductase, partial [Planctomycetia bacterium]